jgi:hypothetical protein
MGTRKGMPPRGDELVKRIEEAVANIDWKEAIRDYAERYNRDRGANGLPPVHLDPPYRPEEERTSSLYHLKRI